MSMLCDREGTFRAEINDYGMKEQESGAIAVTIKVGLTEIWNGEAWEPWEEYGMEAYGDIYVVKKDGTLNKLGVQSLIQHAGWDGNFASVVDRMWQPVPCQVVIKANEYEGNTTYKIAFVNDYDRTPGQLGTIAPDKAKTLQAKFGGELRALAGNAKRNGDAPKDKPPAPPIEKRPINRKAPMADPNAMLQEAGAAQDSIPF
jgi:hypothetical protein